MTETQNPRPDHRAPLAPGEIRTHTVGLRTFTVMHVAGGSFTQATSHVVGGGARVICTEVFESNAVRAYADAIEQAESDAIDELDEADGSMFISSSTGELIDPQAGPAPDADLSFNLPMGANMQLVTGERPTAPSFGEDVTALRQGITDAYTPLSARGLLAALDRIAAQAPVRATAGRPEYPWWLHACGYVEIGDRDGTPPPIGPCTKCDGSEGGTWQPLYTLGSA